MPFGEDFFPDGDMSPPLIQSDLLNSLEAEMDQDFGESAGPTVVALNGETTGVPEADMEIRLEDEVEASAAVAAPSSTIKKRGRPSLSASATPAKSVSSRTPRSTKSTAAPKSAGRSTGKRKAAAEPEPEPEVEEDESEENQPEPEPTPVRKRGRPTRSAGVATSARLAAKAASKPTRGRPRATAAAAKPGKKAGRSKKNAADEEVLAGEFEVESIADSVIDADTMEHMYLVKWKGYPASDNTWEPKKNFKGGSMDLIKKFDAAKKKAEATKKAAAKKEAVPASEKKSTRRGAKPKAVKEVKTAKKGPGRPRKRRAGA